MSRTTFISTTIPYVNAKPHLGHAFEFVESDAYARYAALRGDDVYFLSGSDENSLKNVLAAEKEGISTRELVDRNVVYFQDLTAALQLNIRRFIRTSVDGDHLRGAVEMWNLMSARGDIYAKDYEGLYCVGCEQFYTENELTDGRCPEHLTVPDLVHERNYFFRLSNYGDALVEALGAGRLKVIPDTRRNEVVSFIKAGLEDISISRSMERARGWGIEVPGDPTQVMYVWIDALTNYVTALRWPGGAEYQRYWADADHRVHVVGKGVTRFHAVYWPAMLMSAGLELPTEVVVHGYITASGQKLSKSLGNVVDPADLVHRYGVDAVRYFLLAEFSPFGDGDFSEERLIARYNTDLANGLGNLVSRVTSMIARYRAGAVPDVGEIGEAERVLAKQVVASSADAYAAFDRYDHREAALRMWDLVRRTNAYIDERAPWHLAKSAAAGDESADRLLDTTLHHLAGAVRILGRLISPVLPDSSEKILAAFGDDLATVPVAQDWLQRLAGREVSKPPALFPRLDPVG
jgi:methionyl-tRNA synthetase